MLWQATFSFHVSGGYLEELSTPKPQDAAMQPAASEAEVSALVYNMEEKCMFLSPWHRLWPLRAWWLSPACQWSNKYLGCLQLRESCAVHHCCRLLRFLAVRAGQLQLPALGPPYPKPSPSDQVPDNLSGHPLPDHSPSGVVPPVPWSSDIRAEMSNSWLQAELVAYPIRRPAQYFPL